MKKYVSHCVLLILIILVITIFQGLGPNRSPNDIVSNPKEDFLICMFFTGGLKEEAENSIQTLKNLGLSEKLVVTALDDEAYIHTKDLGVKVEKRQTNLEKITNWGTRSFRKINLNKFDIILNLLQREKRIVVFVDPDVLFLEDISDDVIKFRESNHDVMIQSDNSGFDENAKNKLCTGFIFFKPNEKTLDLLKLTQEKSVQGFLDDQISLNIQLKNKSNGINYDVFDSRAYPNGKRYFDNIDTMYKEYKPTIVHNNWLHTTNEKIDRLKKIGLWFLPPRK